MPSPFPGMNPFIEHPHVWHDFHKTFIPRLSGMLNAELPDACFSRIAPRFPGSENGLIDEERQSQLAVRYLSAPEPVTIIELLSPGLKQPGVHREMYLKRRKELLASSTNLVEIDLLRAGERIISRGYPSRDYCIFVNFPETQRTFIWSVSLRERLPTIPIPLRGREVAVDLQEAAHQVYDSAGYETWLYDDVRDPALGPEDFEWAKQFVPRA